MDKNHKRAIAQFFYKKEQPGKSGNNSKKYRDKGQEEDKELNTQVSQREET